MKPDWRSIDDQRAAYNKLAFRASSAERSSVAAPAPAAPSAIAAILASTSASVVAQPETLIRVAVRPCQTVPPHQQTPPACKPSITARVTSGAPKDTSSWFEHDVVEYLEAVRSKPLGKAFRMLARALDQIGTPARPRLRIAAQTSTPRASASGARFRCRSESSSLAAMNFIVGIGVAQLILAVPAMFIAMKIAGLLYFVISPGRSPPPNRRSAASRRPDR